MPRLLHRKRVDHVHELFISQSLLELALEHAENVSAVRINAIELVIGELSSVIDDSLAFHWDIISRDTIAEGAELRFNRVPAKVFCHDCGAENALKNGQLLCPICGGNNITPTAGTDFLLQSIEVEIND